MDTKKDLQRLIEERFSASITTKQHAFELLRERIERAALMFVETYRSGRMAVFCGNGGSAADAQHLAAEFVGHFLQERRPLPALALNANSSAITAIGNDYGYEHTFARQVEAFGRPGDLLIAISTSGNSKNVVAAVRSARKLGMKSIGLTGEGGGALGVQVDLLLDVPSQLTPRIQECHILIGHILCEAVDQCLFPSNRAVTSVVG